jgi:D-alanyl-D-alanine carboxypeptidase
LISWFRHAHRDATFLRRLAAAGFVLALAVAAPLGSAHAGRYEAIVIDADTGEVLHEQSADVQSYPASLTKMMTLYLVFEALETGRLKLDQQLPVSQHAATRAPSRLGLMAGDTIAVRDVILGLVTKSANDAASVASEALGGTESAFAEKMTQKARQLGMTSTIFRNASGLPDPQQHTTARDLSKLARALYRDHPKEYRYFATESFSYRGAIHANHNHLMSRFEGMDGIKTGFINASGFNLAASAVRNGRRLIGVVMGGQSARARDNQMASLLNAVFSRGGRGRLPETVVASAENDAEEPSVVAEPASDNAETQMAKRAVSAVKAFSPVGTAHAAPAAAPRVDAAQKYTIQLGAFSKQAAADKVASNALAKLRMKGKTVQVAGPAKDDKEKLWRARLAGFNKTEAQHACRTLHKKHISCSVVPPSELKMARS